MIKLIESSIEKTKIKIYETFLSKPSSVAKPNQFPSQNIRLLILCFLFLCFLPFSLILLLFNYFSSKKPKLYFKPTPKNKSILKRCQLLHNTYYPTPYTSFPFGSLFNTSGHLHTFLHEFVRELPEIREFKRNLLEMDDGGLLALDHFVPFEDSKEADFLHADSPVMLIIHGLVGGSHSHYVRHYVKLLVKNGIRPVVMNARGCSFSELRTPKYFTTHYTDDLRRVVVYLRDCYPKSHLFATAYSLGANILTKYLGEEGHSTPLVAALAFANPFDWLLIDKHLQKPFERHFYNFILTRSLVNYLKTHRETFKQVNDIEIEQIEKITTLQEYDEKITCKLWGFENIYDYYSTSCGKDFLENVKIPFLTVQALDDPIIPPEVVPYAAYMKNSNLLLATTSSGGHIAWLEGLVPTGTTWADRVGVEFTHSILDHLAAAESK